MDRNNREYWNTRAKNTGHTGWEDPIIYVYDQKVRLEVISYIIQNYVHSYQSSLDFGGGDGDFTEMLSKQFDSVLYYDLSDVVQERAVNKYGHLKNVVWSTNIENLKDSNQKFDLILFVTVLQHIKDDEAMLEVLKETKDLLSDNGQCIILEDCFDINSRENEYIKFRTINDFKNILVKSGLIIEKEWGFYHPLSRPIKKYQDYMSDKKMKLYKRLDKWEITRKHLLKRLLRDKIFDKYIGESLEYLLPVQENEESRMFLLKNM